MLGSAFEENFAVAVGAETIEPEEAAAEPELILFILAGEEIDEFRRTGFDGAAGFFVFGDDGIAESDQRGVLRRGKIFGRVLSCRGGGLFLAHHLVDVGGGLRRNDLEDGAASGGDGESAQDVAAGDGFVSHWRSS